MGAEDPGGFAGGRIVGVEIDERSVGRSTPDVDHERAVAIYDLVTENSFTPAGRDGGEYRLHLAIVEKRLVFSVFDGEGKAVIAHALALKPLSKVVRDYFLICDSYHAAIRAATPERIEAIDMGRRSLHDEGSRLLADRLKGKVGMDFDTARRLFTLITALHWKG